jgi:uncharacterized membrane protein YdjX (TVP38/TMEM64 family)
VNASLFCVQSYQELMPVIVVMYVAECTVSAPPGIITHD